MAASLARSVSLDRTQGTAQRHAPSHARGAARGVGEQTSRRPYRARGVVVYPDIEAAGGCVEIRLRGFDKRVSLELGTPSDANLRKLYPVLQSDGDQRAQKTHEQVVRVL
jgi:hypothetical protein